jgi:hypothetical protein
MPRAGGQSRSVAFFCVIFSHIESSASFPMYAGRGSQPPSRSPARRVASAHSHGSTAAVLSRRRNFRRGASSQSLARMPSGSCACLRPAGTACLRVCRRKSRLHSDSPLPRPCRPSWVRCCGTCAGTWAPATLLADLTWMFCCHSGPAIFAHGCNASCRRGDTVQITRGDYLSSVPGFPDGRPSRL